MKKILLVLTMALGTCLAVNAQSSQQSEETTTKEVQVQVAGQTSTAETGEVKSTGSTGTKSCCSSKKGKSTSDAHCGDKKQKADASTKKDNE